MLQIAAKINPGGTSTSDNRQKRPHEDGAGNNFLNERCAANINEDMCNLEPDPKKLATSAGPPPIQASTGSRQNPGPGGPPSMVGPNMNSGPPPLGGGPQINEDIKVPDKMVGLSKYFNMKLKSVSNFYS